VTVLHIDASINGENSASRAISRSIVDQLTIERGGADVAYRDLAAEPLPHLTLDAFADSSVLDEFLAADTVVIGAPMYNFTLPTQLKAWIDRIVIAGRTFRYTENGPVGLTGGKRVIVALARGGFYDEGSPASALEHLETYLRGIFNFIGIEPEFVAADGLAVSPEQRQESIGYGACSLLA
jgi:FMN-dependent NADH-azoreductase